MECGILLVYKGIVVGAIGVSGLASDNDGRVAKKDLKPLRNSWQSNVLRR